MKIKMSETTTKTITPPIIMDIGNKALEDEFCHQNGSCSTSMIVGERKHPLHHQTQNLWIEAGFPDRIMNHQCGMLGNQQITSRSKWRTKGYKSNFDPFGLYQKIQEIGQPMYHMIPSFLKAHPLMWHESTSCDVQQADTWPSLVKGDNSATQFLLTFPQYLHSPKTNMKPVKGKFVAKASTKIQMECDFA